VWRVSFYRERLNEQEAELEKLTERQAQLIDDNMRSLRGIIKEKVYVAYFMFYFSLDYSLLIRVLDRTDHAAIGRLNKLIILFISIKWQFVNYKQVWNIKQELFLHAFSGLTCFRFCWSKTFDQSTIKTHTALQKNTVCYYYYYYYYYYNTNSGWRFFQYNMGDFKICSYSRKSIDVLTRWFS